ncbi:MAG: amidase [Actinomycetota bacterium]
MPDAAELTLREAGRAIARGELSPLELTRACLERAGRLENAVKSFVMIDADGALAQAEALTEELARSQPRSPIHGIPLGIKDIIDVRGLPTTASSRVLADNVARADAPVVACLRERGGVVLGKTNTQEFAYGVVTAPTRNPWDLDRIPGGSSGGTAAAVAAGMCPGGLGTDTAGSIRIPAALCGITGLKPRREGVPLEGIVALSWSLDSCGPMGRSALDVDLLWGAMTGAPSARSWEERVHTLRSMRVAAPSSYQSLTEVDPEVEEATEDALERLRGLGHRRVDVDLPAVREWAPRAVLLMTEALVFHRQSGWYPDRSDDYSRETLDNLRHAESFTAADLVAAQRSLQPLQARFLAAFDEADAIVLPSTPVPAPTIEEASRVPEEGGRRPVVLDLTSLCGPVNGMPLAAVGLPCGFTRSGLPIGMQIVAKEESTALGLALSYQSVTDHHLRRPPLERLDAPA